MEVKVTMIPVKDNGSKIQAIVQAVQNQLDQGNRVLILVPNQEAAAFIDQLLWKVPEESFSPHQIVTTSTSELVAITTVQANLNNAQTLINLNPQISPISSQFSSIIDLLDQTHPTKHQLSLERQAAYQNSPNLHA